MSPRRLIQELAEHALWYQVASCNPRSEFNRVPGRFIERLPERQRAVLRQLRSDDTDNVRVDDMTGEGSVENYGKVHGYRL